MAYQKPLPRPNADDKFFWDGCKKQKLLFQKCSNCYLIRWPPSVICPKCYSRDTEIMEAVGRGKIYTYAVYHKVYHHGFTDDVPYVTAVIQLEEGPHFLSNIVDCKPEQLNCDLPVEIVWESIPGGFSLPKFKLVS